MILFKGKEEKRAEQAFLASTWKKKNSRVWLKLMSPTLKANGCLLQCYGYGIVVRMAKRWDDRQLHDWKDQLAKGANLV
jgi:hypothetical protein